jgi:hypothetical protein
VIEANITIGSPGRPGIVQMINATTVPIIHWNVTGNSTLSLGTPPAVGGPNSTVHLTTGSTLDLGNGNYTVNLQYQDHTFLRGANTTVGGSIVYDLTTVTPTLTIPGGSNAADRFNINYHLPEAPTGGSIKLVIGDVGRLGGVRFLQDSNSTNLQCNVISGSMLLANPYALGINATVLVNPAASCVIENTSMNLGAVNISNGGLVTLQNAGPASRIALRSAIQINTTVGSTAKLDLLDNRLLVSNGVVGTIGTGGGGTYSGLTGLIQSGRNAGGTKWTGPGIVTSIANGDFTGIGIATAAQVKGIAANATAVWAGQTVTGSDVLAMYTYGGDGNLDGKLNVDDYGRIDSSIGLGIAGWFNGDFNYDGKVNVDDYGVIDSNIGIQGPPFLASVVAASADATVTPALQSVSAVPEPQTLGGLVLAGGLLVRRRRLRPRKRDA